jgi:hypothetical protein
MVGSLDGMDSRRTQIGAEQQCGVELAKGLFVILLINGLRGPLNDAFFLEFLRGRFRANGRYVLCRNS